MVSEGSLLCGLYARLCDREAPGEGAEAERIDAALSQAVAEAGERFPGVTVAADGFLEAVARRVKGAAETPAALADALEALRLADLYFAIACRRGDGAAVLLFRQRLFPEVANAVRRYGFGSAQIDDLQQALFEKVFLGAPGAAPRIDQYAARGALASWVRVVAARMAQNILRRSGRELPGAEESQLEGVLPAGDPEVAQLKRLYHDDFKQAFQAALGELTAQERNLLRYQILHGMRVDQIAELQGVHRVTMSRRLSKLRQRLLAETRRALARTLGADRSSVESLMQLFTSQFELSVPRLLGAVGSDPPVP